MNSEIELITMSAQTELLEAMRDELNLESKRLASLRKSAPDLNPNAVPGAGKAGWGWIILHLHLSTCSKLPLTGSTQKTFTG